MTTKDLKPEEFAPYYGTYINKLPQDMDLINGFIDGSKNVLQFFKNIPKDKLDYKYADDKWTVKEVFQHMIDTERIFMYRCFRIARHDGTPLAGFEQNDYIEPSRANNKTLESLIEEYQSVRQSFIVLLKSLNDEDLKFIGNASGFVLSARAAAFVILGHEIWHMDIIKERYL